MADGGRTIGVVGSGIAGLRAAKALLTCGVDAEVVIFGDEAHRTYNRPGLTKRPYPPPGAPGTAMAEDLEVAGLDDDALTWRLGTGVDTADLRDKVLHLSTGETFDYDGLVIASGVRARTSTGGSGGSHPRRTLRGLDDAQHIHDELRASGKVTIAGAGFVACELASLAGKYGCEVVMLESPRRGPFRGLLGKRISIALRRWFARHGVTFLPGDPEPSPDRSLFVEAIGSVPNTEWLRGNGLDLSDGVRVDARMRVPGHEDVFAAGDVARYPDPWAAGRLTRIELWKNAIDTGDLAGRSLAASLGRGAGKPRLGYFPNTTSEVFGLRIQVAGNPKASDAAEVVRGDPDHPDRGVLVRFLRGGVAVGVAYLDEGARFNSTYIELLRSLKADPAGAVAAG
ncbi:NAD(P)/FAD-dependent oxidoreductase [Saccharothrix syringae]|uniref:FAD-dependent oxidoreductase n=1 Tax=Saccharothrix syringae TaxID=103733 RepID=A0A5Q0GXX4_SACSY|nr:FAD-dependent oxidoreductase [Saccharothrix syringae]QFZ18768.1 FAD-dependent oxidoreductase [Saccharothrix syringae]